MEIHLGVIRDKEAIYSALRDSLSTKRQLAVCFNSGGKLLVKICTVSEIVGTSHGVNVKLKSQGDGKESETTILVEHIESIYPIRDFLA